MQKSIYKTIFIYSKNLLSFKNIVTENLQFKFKKAKKKC